MDLSLSADAWGMGSREKGALAGSVSRPSCTPARGTTLKSCRVCHRPASPRMRIGKVEFFFFLFSPLFPLSFQQPLVLQLKKIIIYIYIHIYIIFFLLWEHQGKKKSGEREGVRSLDRRAGGGWGGGRGRCGRSVCLRVTGSRGSLLQTARRSPRRPSPVLRGRCRQLLPPLPPPPRCPRPRAARLLALPPLRPGRQTRRWAAAPAVDLLS